ncbi:MAG: hypothetical protein ACRETX_09700, partial [Steroidobacteraceae bacterium]
MTDTTSSMTPGRWARLQEIFDDALAIAITALEPGFTALSMVLMPELAGNAAGPELTILASEVQGEIRAESRDLGTGDLINSHRFIDATRAPRGLFIDEGAAPGIGVIATDASGVLTVQLRNAITGAVVSELEAPGSDPAPIPMPPPPAPTPPPPSGGGGG